MRHFTRNEAFDHYGATVEKRAVPDPQRAFSDIPPGTKGRVIRIECFGTEYDLVVRWELPPAHVCGRLRPVLDYFIRRDWERHIRVVVPSPKEHELLRTSGSARGSAQGSTLGGPVRLRRPLQ